MADAPPELTTLGVRDAARAACRVLSEEPFVGVVDDFLTAEDCAAVVEIGGSGMSRAVVSGAKGGVQSAGRTNSVHWVPHAADPRLAGIADRVAGLLGSARAHAENFQVIHYAPAQEYRAHFDAFDANTERGKRNLEKGGQRVTTTLCYLNAVEAGGGTEFPKLGITVEPKPGRLVIFNNCHEGSFERTPRSLHAGLPVVAGEKWAFNLWFRQHPIPR